MVTIKRDKTGWASARRVLMGVTLLWVVSSPVLADEQSDIQDELKFASELVKWRLTDYAQKAVDRLLIKYPDAKAQAARVRIEVLTSRGKFDEAEALVAGMPAGAAETMVMQLAVGDQYYAWQRMKDAQRVYEAFFKQFPKGPPAEVARLYGESAYKFAQMLVLSGDFSGAFEAYRRVLACPLNSPEIERRVMTEMAEIGLRIAENPATSPATKKAVLEEAGKMCTKVQWQGTDLWFAKTVVILAHIRMLQGDKAGARKVITDYMPMLTDVDKILREAKENMKLSPMAECKFLLGTLYEEEGRALLRDKAKEADCVQLLAKALSQLYTVAKNYPGSNWAPEARRRADAIADVLEKDLKKSFPKPTFDSSTMMVEQLKEARLLFQQQDFKSAAEKYVEVLVMGDRFKAAPQAVSELARCYIELKDDPYARAMTGFLAERFSQGTNTYEEAGSALLLVASAYEERQALLKADQVYDQFYRYYPDHSKVPLILFRQGEAYLRLTNAVEALKNYARIVSDYPRARLYPDALSRQAYCQTLTGDPTNAITTLTNYVAQLSTGVEMLSAKLRLADAYRSSGMIILSLNEYTRLIRLIEQEGATYAGSNPDDLARMRRTQELAMYSKPQCYSRLRDPEAQIPVYQAKAIEGYEAFLKGFPKSEMAPSALGAMGTLYYLLNKPDEAGKAFDRLAKDYPTSQQAMNMVFVRADALMNMGEKDRAVKVYAEMLKNPAQFNPSQFLRAGRVLAEAKEFATAAQLLAEARKSPDVPLWQAATLGYGQTLLGSGQYAEAVKVFEDFLNKYKKSGYVIEVNLAMSRSYGEVAKLEADAAKKKAAFDKALGAMSKVRQYARDPEMMVKADVEMAAIQVLMGDTFGALASYQRILLFTDTSNPKVRPHYEQAFGSSLPLFKETARFADLLEACETYLKQFPQGQFSAKARQSRDEAKAKLAAGK
jgi:TolA-binding protein